MNIYCAIDCDDVIINFLNVLVDEYNKKHGTNHTVENDIKDWYIDKTIFKHGLFESLNDPNIIFKMKLKDDNIKSVLKKYHEKGVKFLLVSATREVGTFDKKLELLKQCGVYEYFDGFINTECKHVVKADVLIDDYIGNLDTYKKYHPFAWTLLYDMPHNQNVNQDGVHTRVRNWKEIDYALGEILNYYKNLEE